MDDQHITGGMLEISGMFNKTLWNEPQSKRKAYKKKSGFNPCAAFYQLISRVCNVELNIFPTKVIKLSKRAFFKNVITTSEAHEL